MPAEFLNEKLDDLEQKGLRRSLRQIDGSQGREVLIHGRKLLNFCSNNYLGIADDPQLKKAAITAIESVGVGSGASRLVCGTMSAHTELEQKLAKFKGTERALVFGSGYMANVGIISGIFSRGDMLFSDRLNHASIIDGILLSQAGFKRYPHRDMSALEKMLKAAPSGIKKGIITDTVFSMDGDMAPLPEIVALAKKYDCLVMVDEAHALGVLGENGKGAVEHFGLEGQVDIQMGTLSKAVGGFGAYCCGSTELIEFLINHARSFIYTTALPPALAAAGQRGIELIESQPQRRKKLWENARYLLRELKKAGFDTLQTETPIIPVMLGRADKAVAFSRELFDQGIFVSAIRPPTVPVNTARLRITVMATHTQPDMEKLLAQLDRARKKLCLS